MASKASKFGRPFQPFSLPAPLICSFANQTRAFKKFISQIAVLLHFYNKS